MAVVYPLVVWLAMYTIAFLMGLFTQYPDIPKQVLFSQYSSAPLFLSLGFGLWIGMKSDKKGGLPMCFLNALIVSLIVGGFGLLYVFLLTNNSAIFLTYFSTLYQQAVINHPLLNLIMSTWFVTIYMTIVAACVGFLLPRSK